MSQPQDYLSTKLNAMQVSRGARGVMGVDSSGAPILPSGELAPVSALFARPIVLNPVGDSLTDFCQTLIGATSDHDIRGFLSHTMAVSYGNTQIGKVLGLSGAGAAAINTAMAAWLPTLPDGSYVVYFAGANNSNDSAAALGATLAAGIRQIVNAGHVPIVCTVMPNVFWTATQAKDDIRVAVNNSLRALRDSGLFGILIEWDHLPFNGPLTFRPGFFTDGTHPGTYGAEEMGVFFWGQLKRYFSPLILPSSVFIGQGTRFSNPMNNGVVTSASGVNPTGWTMNPIDGGSQLYAKVRGTDGDSTPWLQYTATAPAGAVGYGGVQAKLAVGAGTVVMGAQVEIDVPDGATLIEFKARLQSYAGSTPLRRHLSSVSTTDFYAAGTKRWFLRTPPVTLTEAEAASAFIYFDFAIAAGKTVTARIRHVGDIKPV